MKTLYIILISLSSYALFGQVKELPKGQKLIDKQTILLETQYIEVGWVKALPLQVRIVKNKDLLNPTLIKSEVRIDLDLGKGNEYVSHIDADEIAGIIKSLSYIMEKVMVHRNNEYFFNIQKISRL